MRVMTSPDGITWTSRTSATDNTWRSVTYGNGLFVAVSSFGTGNRVMTSPDGITWTSRTSAADNSWYSVTYGIDPTTGNGRFVAVACGVNSSACNTTIGSRVMTSENGLTWTNRTADAVRQWQSVTYAAGLFVAVADGGNSSGSRVMTSPDGLTWTTRTTPADNAWQSVTYGDGRFVAVASSGTGNRVMTSENGFSWTLRESAADNSWNSVTYGDGRFVAVSSSGSGDRVMTSLDGISWTSRTSAADRAWWSVTYGDGRFVAVDVSSLGNRVMTSETSTLTFAGDTPQTIAGDLTGVNAFGNVTVTNTGGDGATTQSVTFTDAVTADGTFTLLASTSAAFPAGATSTFRQVDWRGTAEAPVWLRSTENGTQWYLDIYEQQVMLEYVNVQDSNAAGNRTGPVVAFMYIDSGNNVNWQLPLELSGILYEADQVTPIATPTTVTLAVATAGSVSTYSTTTEATTGAFTIALRGGEVATGTPLIIFAADNASIRAVTVTKSDGTYIIPTLALYQDHVTIRNEDPDGITKASDLQSFDSTNDEDIQFTASADRFTVATGQTLFVSSSTTFHLDLPTGAHHFRVATSATVLASSTLSLTGDLTQQGTVRSIDPTSADWTLRTTPADNHWYSVTYGNGLFVAVAQSGTGNRVMTSPDGLTWTSRTSALDNAWSSVTYGIDPTGLFVAVGWPPPAMRVMTSPMASAGPPAPVPIPRLAIRHLRQRASSWRWLWGELQYCNTTAGTRVMTSSDGITWTSAPPRRTTAGPPSPTATAASWRSLPPAPATAS
jgi:hypothetical protein